ncbi:unnamed protein product [Thlaspi arvense]|uniref:non-specific serine/threonine protein kinase n=1 Tax=Thlaspi arvense TaxID=13288 RepID=A0AAU9RDN3_THLAR|nr:unnamed protein product [Thlaspi arvense]
MSGLKVWQGTFVAIALFIIAILSLLSFCLIWKKKSRISKTLSLPIIQTPPISKEIKEVRIEHVSSFDPHQKEHRNESDSFLYNLDVEEKRKNGVSSSSRSGSGEEGSLCVANRSSSSLYEMATPSPLSGLPESHLGWGHWFTLRDLEIATNRFSKENVIGEGGYGVVYRGELTNGTHVAVKKILNHLGQAEKEFRVEVDAIGHVRHKNLVRLLGYCIEGTHRILVYEYMNNGNLEEWLHGAMRQHGYLTWEARMKVLICTSKALIYTVFLQVNLVEWLKMMVGSKRLEEVIDPNVGVKPATRALKRVLLTALRCIDPDSEKRPKMSQVVRMLESEEYPIPREDRRGRRAQEDNSDTDRSTPVSRSQSKRA